MKTNGKSLGGKIITAAVVVLFLVGFAGLLQAPPTARASSSDAEAGKTTYQNLCLSCHGETGKGDGPAGKYLTPKPADLSEVVKERDEDYLVKIIKEGGAAVGKSPSMPAWGAQLDEDEIENVISYIETFAK